MFRSLKRLSRLSLMGAVLFGAFGLVSPIAALQNVQSASEIVVSGNRLEQAEKTADLAKAITLRPPKDQPLPRHYQPICVELFGLPKEFAEIIAERIRSNMKTLDLSVGGKNCQANAWVGFVSNSYDSVAALRRTNPEMFGLLHDYEIDRVLAGSKAAQAWHALEAKGVDGRPFNYATIEINGVQKSIRVNKQFQTGRLVSTTRVDMIGSIVLFDNKLAAGKTVRQLADYATFRLLAPVKDLGDDQDMPSILALFSANTAPVAGLTEFDWSYLKAYYGLSRGAKVVAVHDAAKATFLRGKGQDLLQKATVITAD
jgi:hypothetical protein